MNRRAVLWIVAAVVAVNAVLWLVDYVAPGTSGKPSSSLATAPRGFAAWAELAQRNGVRVVALRDRLRDARLPDGATVVALDVPRLRRADAQALRRFADRGGSVVVGGRRPQRWLDVFASELSWRSDGPRSATVGDRRLVLAGHGSWAGGATLVEEHGVALLADSSPLQNARLAEGDNAAFALDLAGRGPLVFAESAHGYTTARGLSALPRNAKGALVLLLVAALALMLARGRRFGPVEPEARELAPPRVAYVDALAATLARAKQP
jgi:hypothetical protein